MAIFGGMATKKKRPLDDLVQQARPLPQSVYDTARTLGPAGAPVGGSMAGLEQTRVDPRAMAAQQHLPPPPGLVSGYGGGTFNTDGSQATSVQPDPAVLAMLGAPPEHRKRGVLRRLREEGPYRMAAAQAFANGDYVSGARYLVGLQEQRAETRQAREAVRARYQHAEQVARLPGMNPREFAAYMENPEQWGANMSDALSSHYAAVNVNQTDTRVFGDPSRGGHTYRPPQTFDNGADRVEYDPQSGQTSTVHQGLTDAEQYARSLNLQPGTPQYTAAVQDAMLKANGPTAFGYDQQLEGIKQRDRLAVRGTPTYRDTHMAPPRPPSAGGGGGGGGRRAGAGPLIATDGKGNKVKWDTGSRQWVPVR